MRKNFSLFKNLTDNIQTIQAINNSIKITLGPTGKTALVFNDNKDIKFLTSGSLLIKSLEFPKKSANVLLKLFEQAAVKTHKVSGDGSTTTLLFSCELLNNSLNYLVNGYNAIFLSNGLKKIAYYLLEKIIEFSLPISKKEEIIGILRTSLGKKINSELIDLLYQSVSQIGRDGLIVVEENFIPKNDIEIVQGIELDRGFASSYFINDVNNFEVIYDNPYLLISNSPLNSVNQLREVIDYIKINNRPLVIIAEEINKDLLSTLILNNLQKKFQVAVIKYSSIKFLKTGILEDLATLTYSNYFISNLKNNIQNFTVNDLGQVEKIIIKKDKSTFLVSKFSKLIAKRRINELNRELIDSETEYEKNLLKTRIARLSGNIAKIKIGVSNQYQIEEERQKVENAINTMKSSLEEGILPGGGIFYYYLRDELKNWGYLNLIGEELFAMQIVLNTLIIPFEELFQNSNLSKYKVLDQLLAYGYPYGYDVVNQKVLHTLEEGLTDSAKSVRLILWNSLTLVATIITSE